VPQNGELVRNTYFRGETAGGTKQGRSSRSLQRRDLLFASVEERGGVPGGGEN